MKLSKLLGAFAIVISQPVAAQYIPPKLVTSSPLGVDLATGNFRYEVTDLSIGPLDLQRSYVSGKAGNPPRKWFGPHWTHNFDIYVMEGSGLRFNDTYVSIGRKVVTFTKTSTLFYPGAPESMASSLTLSNGAFVYTNEDGDVYTFNSAVQVQPPNATNPRSQRIDNIVYANGHKLNFIYTSGLLTKIVSNYGYAFVFEYNGSGYVSKACVFNQSVLVAGSTCAGSLTSTTYSYTTINSSPALTSVQDRFGQNWGYDYNINGAARLTCVRQVNSSSCRIQNVPSGYAGEDVTQQTDANGGVWNYYIQGHDPDFPSIPGQPKELTFGSYEGPAGVSATAQFEANLPTAYTENGRTTGISYDGVMITSMSFPEGNSVTRQYTSQYVQRGETWNAKPNSGTANVANTSDFPARETGNFNVGCASVSRKACNKPLYRIDYRGNRTDYSWDQNSGLVLTETGPADSAGIRPVKRSAYAQRYAWISNGAGGYVQAGSPIWVLTSEKTCRTTATSGDACVGGAADETVIAYDYGPESGPNNLLVRGIAITASGTTRRTCYGYDPIGNRVWETKPRAGLAACPAS